VTTVYVSRRALPQLQVLTFAYFHLTPLPAENLRGLLFSLRALHTLQLVYCLVDAVLFCVPVLPSLRYLLSACGVCAPLALPLPLSPRCKRPLHQRSTFRARIACLQE